MEITKEHIQKLINKYKNILKLSVWDIFFETENKENSQEGKSTVNSTYYQLDIVINLAEIRNEEHLEKTIIHELVHAVVAPYQHILNECKEQIVNKHFYNIMAEYELENLVTHLERVIYDLGKNYG